MAITWVAAAYPVWAPACFCCHLFIVAQRLKEHTKGTLSCHSLVQIAELEEANSTDDKDAFLAALLERLQGYLARSPSGIDTAALIHEFGDVPASDVPVFRQLLRAVATCTNGEWTLRDSPSS